MSGNTITLYQNGIAAFERTYSVKSEPTSISLLLERKSVGDVIGTLKVLDDVQIIQPPSYSSDKEKPNLIINPANALQDMAKSLSGASINISTKTSEKISGRLMSLVTESKFVDTQKVEEYFLLVWTATGIRRVPLDEVYDFNFTEKSIQEEINKALAYNLEQTKPNSTPVTFVVKSKKDTQSCRVRYAAPTPAWKLTYRLIENGNKAKPWSLWAFAVVDNNTDEDWKDYTLRLATGKPITFSTDLASIRIPARGHVNLVEDRVQAPVEGVTVKSKKYAASNSVLPGVRCAAPQLESLNFAEAGNVGVGCGPGSGGSPLSVTENADVSEAGDSNVFTCPDRVTIPAHKSALVFLTRLDLSKAEAVVYYDNNCGKRAVKFENESAFCLGRGVCEVEQSGVHVGSAILPNCKPKDSAILCHAVETGLKISKHTGSMTQSVIRHALSKGVLVSEFSVKQTTIYRFESNHENMPMVFDHHRLIANSKVITREADIMKEIPNGVRFEFKLSGSQDVVVTETMVKSQRLEADKVTDWIIRNPESPLLKKSSMVEVGSLGKQLAEIRKDLTSTQSQIDVLLAEQERLRKNLEATKDDRMRRRLVTSEEEIDGLTYAKANLEKQMREFTSRLESVVRSITSDQVCNFLAE